MLSIYAKHNRAPRSRPAFGDGEAGALAFIDCYSSRLIGAARSRPAHSAVVLSPPRRSVEVLSSLKLEICKERSRSRWGLDLVRVRCVCRNRFDVDASQFSLSERLVDSVKLVPT